MADFFATSIMSNTMEMDSDGKYFGTVLASRHGMGENAYVARAVYKDAADSSLDGVLFAYETLANGDVRVYVDEPVTLRVTICRGLPITTAMAGEVEEDADY